MNYPFKLVNNLFLANRNVWLIWIFILLPISGISQQSQVTFKDEQLEKLLRENALKEARVYISQQSIRFDQLTPDQEVYFLNRISQVELMEGSFAEALAQAKKSEAILKKNGESPFWGETYRALCFAYIRNGKLDSALLYAEKLYDFTKVNEDQSLKRAALVAMGNISLQNKSHQKSLDFYLEALQITEKEKQPINLKVDYYNVGLAYAQLNEHTKSNEYLLKAANLAEEDLAWDLVARAYGSIADNFLDLNDFQSQETYLKKANEIAKKIGNTQLLAMGLAGLSESALKLGKYDLAIDWGKKSLEQLKERPLVQLQAKVDSMLYIAYKNKGDFKTALTQFETYDKIRYTLRNQAEKEKLDQLTLEFEVEKKDLLIQNQQISLEEEKAKNLFFIAGILLIGLFAFFVSYINIKNSKTRKFLFKKEREFDEVIQIKNSFIRETETLEPAIESESLLMEDKEHQKLFGEVWQYILDKKLYRNPKLNRQSLINEFGTNRQYLYEAISKNGEDNFRGLVNRFRISEAKEIIDEKTYKNLTIDFSEISEKIGFNSYPTFYRAFKTITGLTPNEYLRELKQDQKIRKQGALSSHFQINDQ